MENILKLKKLVYLIYKSIWLKNKGNTLKIKNKIDIKELKRYFKHSRGNIRKFFKELRYRVKGEYIYINKSSFSIRNDQLCFKENEYRKILYSIRMAIKKEYKNTLKNKVILAEREYTIGYNKYYFSYYKLGEQSRALYLRINVISNDTLDKQSQEFYHKHIIKSKSTYTLKVEEDGKFLLRYSHYNSASFVKGNIFKDNISCYLPLDIKEEMFTELFSFLNIKREYYKGEFDISKYIIWPYLPVYENANQLSSLRKNELVNNDIWSYDWTSPNTWKQYMADKKLTKDFIGKNIQYICEFSKLIKQGYDREYTLEYYKFLMNRDCLIETYSTLYKEYIYPKRYLAKLKNYLKNDRLLMKELYDIDFYLKEIPHREWHMNILELQQWLIRNHRLQKCKNFKFIYEKKSKLKGLKEIDLGGYSIRVPRSREALIDLGDKLNICVGAVETYSVDIKNHRSYILPIYKDNEAYGCVEYSRESKSIIQARLKYNENMAIVDEECYNKIKEYCKYL